MGCVSLERLIFGDVLNTRSITRLVVLRADSDAFKPFQDSPELAQITFEWDGSHPFIKNEIISIEPLRYSFFLFMIILLQLLANLIFLKMLFRGILQPNSAVTCKVTFHCKESKV